MRLARAVVCQTRDLGIMWQQWHTLIFEGQVAVDMRGLPAGREKDVSEASQDGLLEEIGREA